MKALIIVSGLLLIAVQGGVLFGVLELEPMLVSVLSLVLAVFVVGASLALRRGDASPSAASPAKAAPNKESPAKPSVDTAKSAHAEAEIVAFLALLQAEGRLVDFAQELIDDASDEQVGAAARVVHAGVRKVIRQHIDLGPVRSEQEGASVVLKSGFDPALYRLVGKVPDLPPYTGRLLHPGWAVRSVRLPEVTGMTKENPWPVVAPAEIEVQQGA